MEPQQPTSCINAVAPSISISDIPGPKNPSWIYGSSASPTNRWHSLTKSRTGHTWWWMSDEFTVVEKKLLEEYGAVSRWNGSLRVCFFSGSGGVRSPLMPLHRKNACGLPTQGHPPYPPRFQSPIRETELHQRTSCDRRGLGSRRG